MQHLLHQSEEPFHHAKNRLSMRMVLHRAHGYLNNHLFKMCMQGRSVAVFVLGRFSVFRCFSVLLFYRFSSLTVVDSVVACFPVVLVDIYGDICPFAWLFSYFIRRKWLLVCLSSVFFCFVHCFLHCARVKRFQV